MVAHPGRQPRKVIMEFEFAFHYTFTYVPRGARNDRNAVGRSRGSVEIRELSEADAPVALRLANQAANAGAALAAAGSSRFNAKPDGSLRAVRRIGREFYVEATTVNEFSTSLHSPKTLGQTFLAKHPRSVTNKHLDPARDPGPLSSPTTLAEIEWRSRGLRKELTKDDGGEKVLSLMREQASGMIIVGDALYERCREPVLMIDRTRIGPDDGWGFAEAPLPEAHPYISTSGLEDAIALLRAHGVEPPDRAFEILDASALCHDGFNVGVWGSLRRAFLEAHKEAEAASSAFMRDFFRFRDALARVDPVSPSVSREVAEAARSLLSSEDVSEVAAALSELQRARYMNAPVSSYVKAVDPDLDTPFEFDDGLLHVANVRERHDDAMRKEITLALDRYDSPSAGSIAPHDTGPRATSLFDDVAVTEITSLQQARDIAWTVGADVPEVEKLFRDGIRLFRVAEYGEVPNADYRRPSERLPVETVALTVFEDGIRRAWTATDDAAVLSRYLEATERHVSLMLECDMHTEQSQELILSF